MFANKIIFLFQRCFHDQKRIIMPDETNLNFFQQVNSENRNVQSNSWDYHQTTQLINLKLTKNATWFGDCDTNNKEKNKI